MKRLILPLLIGTVLLTSCGNLNRFTKQKFTKLRKIEFKESAGQEQEAILPINDLQENDPCDTLKLVNGETLEVEVVEQTEKKIRYRKYCKDCDIVYTEKKTRVEQIIEDPGLQKKREEKARVQTQPKEEKEKKPRNKKLIGLGWASFGSMLIAPAVLWILAETGSIELGGLILGLWIVGSSWLLGIIFGIVFMAMGFKNKKLKKK